MTLSASMPTTKPQQLDKPQFDELYSLHPFLLHPPVHQGIEDKKESQCGGNERGFCQIHIQTVELGGGYGKDGCRRAGGKNHAGHHGRIRYEEDGKSIEHRWQKEKFHRENGPQFSGVLSYAVQMEVIPHRHHAHPCAEMNKNGKEHAHGLRPLHVAAGKEKPHRHSHRRKLVRRQEESEDTRLLSSQPIFGMGRFIEALGHGEAIQHDDQDLGHSDELHIGKAPLPIEHVGAKPCQGTYISEHHGNHVASLVQRGREPALLKEIKHENRKEADRNNGDRKPQKFPGHMDSPEGNHGKERSHHHHVRLDYKAQDFPGKPPFPKPHAQGQGQEDVRKYNEKPGIHGFTSFHSNKKSKDFGQSPC